MLLLEWIKEHKVTLTLILLAMVIGYCSSPNLSLRIAILSATLTAFVLVSATQFMRLRISARGEASSRFAASATPEASGDVTSKSSSGAPFGPASWINFYKDLGLVTAIAAAAVFYIAAAVTKNRAETLSKEFDTLMQKLGTLKNDVD